MGNGVLDISNLDFLSTLGFSSNDVTNLFNTGRTDHSVGLLDVAQPNDSMTVPSTFSGPNSESGRSGTATHNEWGLLWETVNSCYTCGATGKTASEIQASCEANGSIQQCSDNSMCSIEVRRRNGVFAGFNTGCKR